MTQTPAPRPSQAAAAPRRQRRWLALAAALPALGAAGCAHTTLDDLALRATYAPTVASYLQTCKRPYAYGAEQEDVQMRVYVDGMGVVRGAYPLEPAPLSVPADQTIVSVLDRRCALLPLPQAALGRNQAYDIALRP